MFRLDHILERWAELYTPLSHNSVPAGSASGARKSFFRIGMIDAQSYFVRNYNMMNGCCMAYATHVDAELAQQNPKAVSYRHVIYFLVKQQNAQGKTDVTDEDAATEARFLTDDMGIQQQRRSSICHPMVSSFPMVRVTPPMCSP